MLKKTIGSVGPENGTRANMDTLLEELEKLPLAERMQLVEDLWDSIARSREELPIPQWQKDVLEKRRHQVVLRSKNEPIEKCATLMEDGNKKNH